MNFKFLFVFVFLILSHCASSKLEGEKMISEDPYLWLEEIESKKALDWAKDRNQETFDRLKKDPRFASTEAHILTVMEDPEKIPYGTIRNGYVYNFWRDAKHVQGIYRRTLLESYKSKNPVWETLIDFDLLSKEENKTWVYKGIECFAPSFERCLIRMSDGGSDASISREFDFVSKSFVKENAFFIPESKHRVTWVDRDTLFIGYDFGKESLTESGYPRTSRRWKRGTPIESSELIFEGLSKDVSVGAWRPEDPQAGFTIFYRALDFYNTEHHIQFDFSDEKIKLDLPSFVSIDNYFKGRLILTNRKPWSPNSEWGISKELKAGSLVSLKVDLIKEMNWNTSLNLIWEPDQFSSLESFYALNNYLLLNVVNNVQSIALRAKISDQQWLVEPLHLPENGTLEYGSYAYDRDDVFLYYESFLSPETQFHLNVEANSYVELRSKKHFFDSSRFVSEQFQARSADGVLIPYFVIKPKKLDSLQRYPVLMYGYGGFEIALKPFYSASVGAHWLEKGGIYVLANIRGGGEFGPTWHQAALKQNRQKAFDDFHAIAEDLIARNITSPQKIAISGGSNGGLLVGTAFTQRPDLYGAVACSVPLLDMMRYHKLLAGASWVGEYGNPDIAEEREYLLKYSPYHNVFQNVKYPEVYFFTSTKDDRVHPAHARKMVAKMRAQGHSVLYYENIEGGHGGAANFKQSAMQEAMKYVYFWQKLMPTD